MAIPTPAVYWVYQGVVIAEIAFTLLIFVVLRFIHYVKWGHLDDNKQAQVEKKQEAEVDDRKWNQESWNIYFPIIFANHVIAIALPFTYNPSIFIAVISWIHFGLFMGILILNIFIREPEPGTGNRTKATRILWGLMCVINLILLITGIAGMNYILSVA